MANFFQIKRGWMNNPIFETTQEKPYSTREAWIWLVEHACWSEHKTRINGLAATLGRGQLSYSHDYLAKAWCWHRSSVGRFLNRLKREGMIETDNHLGQLIITICNYDKDQLRPGFHAMSAETKEEIRAEQRRDESETNKNTKLISDNTQANSSRGDIASPFEERNANQRVTAEFQSRTKKDEQAHPSIDREAFRKLRKAFTVGEINIRFCGCEFDFTGNVVIAPTELVAQRISATCETGLRIVFGCYPEVRVRQL